MKKIITLLFGLVSLVFLLGSCRDGKNTNTQKIEQEDLQAKKLLQGIWINQDEGSVVFKVHGDTIYYPDSASVPVYFKIVADSLVLQGSSETKYAINKQSAHLFIFKNQYGDEVRLVKSNDPDDKYAFIHSKPVVLNQNNLIKRDTVIIYNKERYHLYVQVNPTTYKIIKNTYTDEGVEVGNIYYDNIIHLSVFNGAKRLFSRDFHKQDFKNYIPKTYFSQCILSDIIYDSISDEGVVFKANLPIPDTTTSYIINIYISFAGVYKLSV